MSIENLKRIVVMRKLSLQLVPRVALVQGAAVLGLGADCPAKAYGWHNWRSNSIDAERVRILKAYDASSMPVVNAECRASPD